MTEDTMQSRPLPQAQPGMPENLPDLPCDVCRDLIPLVQDGAASPTATEMVRRHMAHCESCLAFWQEGAPAQPAAPDDGRVLGKIYKRLRLLLFSALAAGALSGLWLMSYGFAGQFNLLIMPAVGAVGALLLRRRWYLTPLCVAVLGFVWHLSLENTGPVLGLIYAAFYGGLCLLGGVAAMLFRYAFGKEELP